MEHKNDGEKLWNMKMTAKNYATWRWQWKTMEHENDSEKLWNIKMTVKTMEHEYDSEMFYSFSVIFMFHSFLFNSLVRLKYVSLFSFSFLFHSAVYREGKIHNPADSLFFYDNYP